MMRGVDGRFWDTLDLGFPGLAFGYHSNSKPVLYAFSKKTSVAVGDPLLVVVGGAVTLDPVFAGFVRERFPPKVPRVRAWMVRYI